MKKKIDLTGRIFGNLIVIKLDKIVKEKIWRSDFIDWRYLSVYYWLCKCSCGKESSIRERSLLNGGSESCGCRCGFKEIHGMSYFPEYNVWNSMVGRCQNENNEQYKNYGRRGINVCQFIAQSPDNFTSVIGYRPSKKYSIERINNDKGYTCGKCEECLKNGWELNIKWDTWKNQANNRRPTRIEILGVDISTYDLALKHKDILENPVFIL
ncbi:MAG TPA: hypothetical protein VF849_00050 [Blattabacteriaceae bacterium]